MVKFEEEPTQTPVSPLSTNTIEGYVPTNAQIKELLDYIYVYIYNEIAGAIAESY